MSIKEFILQHPFYAILTAIGFAVFLFFPLILLVIVAIGWVYSHYSDSDKPTTTKPSRTTPSTYSSPNLDRWTTERYHTYLKSPEWKNKVYLIKQRDQVCQLTGSSDNLEVHHITYDRLGSEDLTDLVLLSRSAHQFVHDYYGSYSRNNTYPIENLKGMI
jgi:5-methylcytosine-specific restriction endonuclease McrA